MAQTIQATPDDFAVLAGDDWATLPMLALGGRGIISTVSNIAASDVVELVRSFRAGELDHSRDTHYRLLPLIDAVFCETNPIPIKAALALRGLIQEELRLPLTPLSPPNRERLPVALKEFGIL